MNFEDLKDRLLTEGRQALDKIQESSTYNKLMDNYNGLSPSMQKLTVVGSVLAISGLILSVPWSYYSTSQEYEAEFLTKRQIIRDLLKTARESQSVPNISQAPSVDMLKSMIESQISNAQLLPEQRVSVTTVETDSKLISEKLSSGAVEIQLAKLNLKQTVDIGYQLQSLHSSVKMANLVIQPNKQNPKYFDVKYKLISLAVPLNAGSEGVENN